MPYSFYFEIRLFAPDDDDPSTLDFIIRANVVDSAYNDVDVCELSGMNVDHNFYVFDGSPTILTVWAGGWSDDDCPVGKYAVKIVKFSGSSVQLGSPLYNSFEVVAE